MQKNYGATPDEWARAAALFGASNLIPIAPEGELSPASRLDPKDVGKVPSVYNSAGKIAGFKDWTSHEATPAEIDKWKRRGYNIGLILGRDSGDGTALCAVDVDTAVADYQDKVYDLLVDVTGMILPYRGRDNSERRAYILRAPADVMARRAHILPEEDGKKAAVEFLAKGQQVVIHGQHPSKGRYQWIDSPMIGLSHELQAADIPTLTAEQFAELWAAIAKELPVTDSTVARAGRQRDLSDTDPSATDDVAGYLDANGWTISVSADGSRNLLPFRDESEYSNGCSETSIKYFPAGTGGFQQGHFVSLHATDTGLTDADWLDGYGVRDNDFDDVTEHEDKVQGFTDVNVDMTRHFLERFIYVVDGDKVCDLSRPPYNCMMVMQAFKNLMAPHQFPPIGKGNPTPATKAWIEHHAKQVAESVGYQPGVGRVIERHDGRFEINEFYMPDHPKTADIGKVQTFLNHMTYLVPDPWQREFFIARLAWFVQRPERRCPISILHVATAHGTGRGWVSQLMEKVLGPWNCARARMKILCDNQYHDYLYHTLLCTIDEVRENDKRYEVNDKIRDVLTEPRFEVNRKYGRKMTIDIFTGFLFYTNHYDALALPEEDRRIAVLGGPDVEAGEDHYAHLYGALSDSDFIAQVYWYLMGVDISRFNWQRAPMTKERALMIESNKSDVEAAVLAVLENPPVPAMTYQQVVNEVLKEVGFDVEINQKHITRVLKEKTKREPVRVKIDGNTQRFWLFEKNNDFNNEKLREMFETCEKLQNQM